MLAKHDDLSVLKLLYVEDDPAIRESLTRFLSRRISDIAVAQNGEEGLKLFKETNPDIIITDIRMPVMDGIRMIEEIRNISPNVPIIITSAHNDEEFYQKAIDLAVDKYIKKPINLKDLVNVISVAARMVIQQRELEAQNRLIREILDISQNFMFITDGEKIGYANKALLFFAGCKTLEEFNKKGGLGRLMVAFENTFYRNKSFGEWVKIAANSKDPNSLIAYMQAPEDKESDVMAFMIQINRFPSGQDMLISFSDITNLEKEKLYYQEIAQYDELTKIYNRKKFNESLAKEIDRVIRYRSSLSIAMFDVDFFKKVNDTYGHMRGDEVLKDIVNVVNNCIRKSDIFCRYGGEEFVLIMPETKLEPARDTVDRIRKKISEYEFEEVGRVTCSFGVTEFKLADNASSVVARVDEALYKAKEDGRNLVVAIP